jgi:hypothetical protein
MQADYWYLLAEFIAAKLINAGAWRDAVYLYKDTAVEDDEDTPYPNICVYVDSDRTREKTGDDLQFMQEFRVKVEIRERFNSLKDHAKGVYTSTGGLPNHPALNTHAMRRLAVATAGVKSVLVAALSDRIELGGKKITVDSLGEISTDIERSSLGALQHCMATIDFLVTIPLCYEREAIDSCPLNFIFGEFNYTQCIDSDTLKSAALLEGAALTGDC